MSEATSKDATEIPQDALPVEGGFGADGWEASVKIFWSEFDDARPVEMVAAMESLAAECPHKDGTALYELGSVCDSVGREAEAAEFYERATAAGLSGHRAMEIRIQHASTLRNLGRTEESVAMLQDFEDKRLGDAPAFFLALSLHSTGRKDEALSVALAALAEHLPLYNRSARAYAAELNR